MKEEQKDDEKQKDSERNWQEEDPKRKNEKACKNIVYSFTFKCGSCANWQTSMNVLRWIYYELYAH